MWPIVPTLTCGFVRWKTSLAIVPPRAHLAAHLVAVPRRDRVGDIGWRLSRELLVGVEPTTSSLPRTRSTTELQQPGCQGKPRRSGPPESGRWELNPQRLAWKAR